MRVKKNLLIAVTAAALLLAGAATPAFADGSDRRNRSFRLPPHQQRRL